VLWNSSYEVSIYIALESINSSPLSRNYNVYPRYVRIFELGLPILYEISIKLAEHRVELRKTMGDENYEILWKFNTAIDTKSKTYTEISFSIPVSLMSIEEGSIVYIAVAIFRHGYLIEHSTMM